MPNWCNNTLELSHKDPEMMKRAVHAYNRGELLNEFVPVPEELKIIAGRTGDEEENKRIIEQEESNREKFGYSNWYDFCVNEWGTKWDVGGNSDYGDSIALNENGSITISFDSAWSPPTTAYEKLVELGFEVRGYYYEPGMGFAGIFENGFDDYYEYGDCANADAVADMLPAELDEMFGISENIREWEEENQEIDLDGGLSAVNE